MITPEQTSSIQPKLMLIQIIAAALITSVLVFAGVICALTDWGNLNTNLKMLSLIAATSGALMLSLSVFAPKVFAPENGERVTDADQSSEITATVNTLMAETLIRYVLIEAALFLNLMVFLIEPHRAALIIVAVGVLMMLVCFPRQSKMIAVIEDRLR